VSTNRRVPIVVLFVVAALGAAPAGASDMQGTLSVIGVERSTGAMGVAVVSHAPACGAEVPWVQAGTGAVATQGDVNADWGPAALGLLRDGMEPQALCDTLYKRDPAYLRRQIGVLDRRGRPGGYTGLELTSFSGGVIDTMVAVQGNALAGGDVLLAVHDSFVVWNDVPLPERLLASLRVGAAAASRPLRSAALLVGRVDPERPAAASRWIYLRVDDHPDPLAELERLYRVHAASRLVESHLHFAELGTRAGRADFAGSERGRAEALVAAALADSLLPPTALNAMAWGMAQHGAWLDRAELAARRAQAGEPTNPEYLDTLAELRARQGDRPGALVEAKRAFALAPRDDYFRERVLAFGGTAADATPPDNVHPNQKARAAKLKK
jgi:uncharacterized Ntn-hydrolase superfamily protein